MDKKSFQSRMEFGVRKIQEVMGKTIVFEYSKVASSTKIRESFIGTYEKLSDEALKEQTTYNKDSMIFKILVSDLVAKLGDYKVKNKNGIIYMNNTKYNVVTEEISSDEVLMKLYANTV